MRLGRSSLPSLRESYSRELRYSRTSLKMSKTGTPSPTTKCLTSFILPSTASASARPSYENPWLAQTRTRPRSRSSLWTSTSRADPTSQDDSEWSRWALSTEYQWLPTDFSVSSSGDVECLGYINNIHPIHRASLYRPITAIIGRFVPMFERVLSDTLAADPVLAVQVDPFDWYDEEEASDDLVARGVGGLVSRAQVADHPRPGTLRATARK